MGEAEKHEHSHGEHLHVHTVTRNLTLAFFLNLSFTIIELIGAYLTNSMAIFSDAIHDLGDSLAIGSAIVLEKRSEKKRDNKFSYGYRRFSTLAALLNVVILTTGSILIVVESVPRLLEPQEVHSQGMMGLAVLGVFINGIAVLRLRGDKGSLNNRTVMLHLMEDVLGWLAVLFGSIIIYFTHWFIIDPIMSLLIAGYILFNALRNFNKISMVFMQAVPGGVKTEDLQGYLNQIEEIKEVHDVHMWSLDGEFNVASLHLVTKQNLSMENLAQLKKEVRERFKKEGIGHVTIEIEGPEEDCAQDDCN